MKKPHSCPCKSGKTYSDCCQPFHEGALPEHAVQLMRSRYSAYALGLLDYIIKTTHPDNSHYEKDTRKWKKELLSFVNQTSFFDLKILFEKEEENTAEVTFVAILKVQKQDASFIEHSIFKKEEGRWLYYSGRVQEDGLSSLHR